MTRRSLLAALLLASCFSAEEPPPTGSSGTTGASATTAGSQGTTGDPTTGPGSSSSSTDVDLGAPGTTGPAPDPALYAECADDADCPAGWCLLVNTIGSICTQACGTDPDCAPPSWYVDADTTPVCVDWGDDRQCMMGCDAPSPGCPDPMVCRQTSAGYFCFWPEG